MQTIYIFQQSSNNLFILMADPNSPVWNTKESRCFSALPNCYEVIIPWCRLQISEARTGALLRRWSRVITNARNLLQLQLQDNGLCCTSERLHVPPTVGNDLRRDHRLFWTRILVDLKSEIIAPCTHVHTTADDQDVYTTTTTNAKEHEVDSGTRALGPLAAVDPCVSSSIANHANHVPEHQEAYVKLRPIKKKAAILDHDLEPAEPKYYNREVRAQETD